MTWLELSEFIDNMKMTRPECLGDKVMFEAIGAETLKPVALALYNNESPFAPGLRRGTAFLSQI